MGLYLEIPIFPPVIAFITNWLQTKIFVHMLVKLSSFKETFFHIYNEV
jgi:hypothetical protein